MSTSALLICIGIELIAIACGIERPDLPSIICAQGASIIAIGVIRAIDNFLTSCTKE